MSKICFANQVAKILNQNRTMFKKCGRGSIGRLGFKNLRPNFQLTSNYIYQNHGLTDKQTNGHGQIDSAIDSDQEYKHFIGSEKFSSNSYLLFKAPSIPCTLRVTGVYQRQQHRLISRGKYKGNEA